MYPFFKTRVVIFSILMDRYIFLPQNFRLMVCTANLVKVIYHLILNSTCLVLCEYSAAIDFA